MLYFPIIVSLISIVFAISLILRIQKAPSGSEKIQEISRAIREGAIAFLKREYKTVVIVAIPIFLLLWKFFDFKVGIGLQLAPTIMANDKMTLSGAKKDMSAQGAHISKKPRDDEGKKIGRNDDCPCGSGKKYKKCCGK